MAAVDLGALWLTLTLAFWTTLALLILGTPLAWWLSQTHSRAKPVIQAITALPLVLPPTVLGFYLLLLLSPSSPIGGFWLTLTGDTLTFSFAGILIASILYSLPFMVQPLQASFEQLPQAPLDAAATLGATPLQLFRHVAAPLAGRGFLTASVLTFTHTLGEFGVVLMVGGNIPGETRVISIEVYEHVETLRYDEAHTLAALLLVLAFVVLFALYAGRRRPLMAVR